MGGEGAGERIKGEGGRFKSQVSEDKVGQGQRWRLRSGKGL